METKIPSWVVNSFEAAFGVLLFVGGVTTMLSWQELDPFEQTIPYWLLILFNVLYSLSGLSMTLGLIIGRGNVEAAGLFLLMPLLVGRALLYGHLLGWGVDSILSLVFSFIFTAACAGRLYVILRT